VHADPQRRRPKGGLRESESRLSFLDRLSAEAAPLLDADAVLATTTRLVGEHLNLSVCAYADMDADQDGFTIRGDWAAPGSQSIVGRYRLADFGRLAVTNLTAGLPLVVNDNLRELAPEEAATFQSIGIAATICMPLVKEGRLTALMAIHDRRPRTWTSAELDLLEEVTERSWAHVERVRAVAELRASEARFRQMADAIPQIVWITDGAGRTEFFNKQWADYTGAAYEPSTAGGIAADFVHPDDAQPTMEAFEQARRTGETFRVEHRIRSKDGAYRWFLVRGEPQRDPRTGEIMRWFGASTDIDDRRQVEAALRESEERLRELNDSLEGQVAQRTAERDRLWTLSEDLLARADYTGMMSAVSPAWTRVLGFGETELLTRPYADLLHPDDAGVTMGALGRMRETGRPTRFENRLLTADGAYKAIEWTVAPEPDGSNFIAVGRDVSAEKERQAELETTQEALRQSQKLEAVGQLTGGMAHDFNNLLTVIRGSVELLLRPGVSEQKQRRYLAAIADTTERATKLTSQLLAFARRQTLKPEVFDAAEGVRALADMIATLSGSRISVEIGTAPEPCFVNADRSQFDTALINFAVNARDAMDGVGRLSIDVRPVPQAPAIGGAPALEGTSSPCRSPTRAKASRRRPWARSSNPSSPPRRSAPEPAWGCRRCSASPNSPAARWRCAAGPERAPPSPSTCPAFNPPAGRSMPTRASGWSRDRAPACWSSRTTPPSAPSAPRLSKSSATGRCWPATRTPPWRSWTRTPLASTWCSPTWSCPA
jgi:PAS domain S-box-containing protein